MSEEAPTYENSISESIAKSLEVNMPLPAVGPKNDQDNYSKPDLSLVPLTILQKGYLPGNDDLYMLQVALHLFLNDKSELSVDGLFDLASRHIDVKELAVALGYGCVKYHRDSWMIGFGGDHKRFLRAAMRHCDWFLRGDVYDGEVKEGYPLGANHLGCILFSLMIAVQEFNNSEDV